MKTKPRISYKTTSVRFNGEPVRFWVCGEKPITSVFGVGDTPLQAYKDWLFELHTATKCNNPTESSKLL